MDVKAYVNQLT
jgi:chromosome segregation ATPase